MKILIVHNRYSRPGGEEQVVQLQRRLLEEHGHRVILYERSYDEIKSWKLGRLKSLFTAIRNRRAVKDIRRIIRDEKPDTAIVHNLFPVISAAILPVLAKSGVRILMTVHNFRLICPTGLFYTHDHICERCGAQASREWHCLANRCEGTIAGSAAYALRGAWSRLRRYYLQNVDLYLCLTSFQRDKLVSYGIPADRCVLLPNCVDPRRMAEPAADTVREKFIGYVGRLSEEKGVDLLFETARRLPRTTFKVAGEAALNFKSETVPANLELLGRLDGEQLARFYREARLIVLTSKCYEGFPLAMLEAMYYETPVAVPHLGSLPEILDGGKCGFLYPLGCSPDLARIIETTSDDLLVEKGKAGRQKVMDRYTSEAYYRTLEKYL